MSKGASGFDFLCFWICFFELELNTIGFAGRGEGGDWTQNCLSRRGFWHFARPLFGFSFYTSLRFFLFELKVAGAIEFSI